ncbi:MAG TPA: zinc dependent phospholipase C family protein [Ilumatobacteraceae bacterium]
MFLWFIGTAVASVWYVFRDPRFDYRLLALGALLPDIIDLPGGQARWAHSLTVAVGVLLGVMLLTAGRRPARRLLLALPIGMLLHLVWDGAFSSTHVFWWPFAGSWGSVRVPSLQRGWLDVVFELIGAVLLIWMWRRCLLSDRDRRTALVRHGVLSQPAP